MRKFFIIAYALALFIVLNANTYDAPATASPSGTGHIEVIVFAAASMTDTLEEIAGLYAKVEPNATLTFNFDSSGTLRTQIQEGAESDVFISAAQLQMNQLDITSPETINPNRFDLVNTDTRFDILENRVVLAVPSGNPKNINSFQDMSDMLSRGEILMAIGNRDVPVGQYTLQIFEYFNLVEQELVASGSITYGSNVREVTTHISEASVDCGIIYATDAFSTGLNTVDHATTDMCGRVVYPAAVLRTSKNPDAARAFLNYLTSNEAMAVFESVGFSRP